MPISPLNLSNDMRSRYFWLFCADPPGARNIDDLIVGAKALYLEVGSRTRRIGGRRRMRFIQGFAAQLIDPRDRRVDIIDLKADVINAQFHRLSLHTWTQIQNRNIQMAIGKIDAALTGAHLFQAKGLFIECRGFFDIAGAKRNMLDLRHGLSSSARGSGDYLAAWASFKKRQSIILSSVTSPVSFSC